MHVLRDDFGLLLLATLVTALHSPFYPCLCSTLATYMISIARKHTMAGSLSSELQGQGLPATAQASTFCSELLERMPRKAGAAPTVTQVNQVKGKDRWAGLGWAGMTDKVQPLVRAQSLVNP